MNLAKKPLSFLMIAFMSLSGCASVKVKPAGSELGLQHVCIEDNPKVAFEGLEDIISKGFARHNITTELYTEGKVPEECRFILNYTARRSWDIVPYMSYARLELKENGETVAEATYTLIIHWIFIKFKSVEAKMNPVIDKLLANYEKNT